MTVKELHAIQEQIEVERLLASKYKMYSYMCSDPQIKAKCEEYSGKHEEHENILLQNFNTEEQ